MYYCHRVNLTFFSKFYYLNVVFYINDSVILEQNSKIRYVEADIVKMSEQFCRSINVAWHRNFAAIRLMVSIISS